MNKFTIYFFIVMLGGAFSSLQGEIRGKLGLAPVLLDVDILESGKTIETLHMKGVKGDATVLFYKGFCIKPGFLWGQGHGELTAGNIALGCYVPICKDLKILPNIGCTWSYLHTTLDLEEVMLFGLRERFRSSSPFLAMEISYSITDKWTLIGVYQYAWSRTHTKISSHHTGTVASDKSHTCGPNYSLGVDYSFNEHWSLVFGVGYNITLSKEKHGLRGKGAQLGVAYYF